MRATGPWKHTLSVFPFWPVPDFADDRSTAGVEVQSTGSPTRLTCELYNGVQSYPSKNLVFSRIVELYFVSLGGCVVSFLISLFNTKCALNSKCLPTVKKKKSPWHFPSINKWVKIFSFSFFFFFFEVMCEKLWVQSEEIFILNTNI